MSTAKRRIQAGLFVSHRSARLTLVERATKPHGWDERELRAGEILEIPSLGLRVAVDAIYEGITLDRV